MSQASTKQKIYVSTKLKFKIMVIEVSGMVAIGGRWNWPSIVVVECCQSESLELAVEGGCRNWLSELVV